MERKRTLVLVLCCVVVVTLLSGTSIFAQVPRAQPPTTIVPEPDAAIETGYLASQADPSNSEEDRMRSAVDTYFTLQYESMVVDKALNLGVVVDKTTEEGRALLNYEQGRLEYFLFGWRNHGFTTTDYDYHPIYESIQVDGDTAVVHVRPWADLWHPSPADHPETAYGDLHVMTLVHRPAGWRIIADEYSNEWKQIWPVGTDFAALQASYHKDVAEAKAREAELQRQYGGQKPLPQQELAVASGTRSYDRARAASYADTYTNNDGGCSTTNYNSNFINYNAPHCTDCQNFVSQCVWYGFGGVNDYNHITYHSLPMIDDFLYPNETPWWGDKNGSWNTWRLMDTFYTMMKSNRDNNRAGVQGYEGWLSLTWRGDILWWRNDALVWDHAMMVVETPDYNGNSRTDYNEIYYSGHTNNRRHVRLITVVPEQSRIRYFWPTQFKEP